VDKTLKIKGFSSKAAGLISGHEIISVCVSMALKLKSHSGERVPDIGASALLF